ncbi:growth hormone secretagogue receptor type 1-like [Saccoglossus kowalevskii]
MYEDYVSFDQRIPVPGDNTSTWPLSLIMYENDSISPTNGTYGIYMDCEIDYYFMVTCFVILGLTGFLGNGLFIFVVIRVKSMRTLPNYFMINLACADVLCSTNLLIFPLLEFVGVGEHMEVVSLRIFLENSATFATMTTVFMITLDRYIVICHPFIASRIQSKSRVRVLIFVTWLISVCLSLTEFLSAFVHEMHIMAVSTFIVMSYLVYTTLILVTVIVLYTMIIRCLVIGSKTIQRLPFRKKREFKNETKVLLMCSIVVSVFLVCFAPQLILLFLAPIPLLTKTFPNPHFFSCVAKISPLMIMFNFALNPIIYNLPSKRHRLAFKKAFFKSANQNERVGLYPVTSARTTNSINSMERQLSRS